jgi:hypothetical protein
MNKDVCVEYRHDIKIIRCGLAFRKYAHPIKGHTYRTSTKGILEKSRTGVQAGPKGKLP